MRVQRSNDFEEIISDLNPKAHCLQIVARPGTVVAITRLGSLEFTDLHALGELIFALEEARYTSEKMALRQRVIGGMSGATEWRRTKG